MEPIDLADLSFDFEGYFARWRRGDLSAEELREFDARAIGLFCRRVLDSGSARGEWSDDEEFAALYLAKNLRWVIGGVPWRKQFDLPFDWGTRESDFTRTGERAAAIYSAVQESLRQDSSHLVTDLIRQQADAYCVSFETAREDYYKAKTEFEAGRGFRAFLNLGK